MSDPSTEETDAIAAVDQALRHEILQRWAAGIRPARRDAHAKHHGCIRGVLTINANLPSAFKHGLFASPAPYDVWIRFSNSIVDDDAQPDVRGMAIKVLGVSPSSLDGPSDGIQDFLLVNSRAFFIKDARDYVKFPEALAAGPVGLLRFFLSSGPHGRRWRQFAIVMRSRVSISNPL